MLIGPQNECACIASMKTHVMPRLRTQDAHNPTPTIFSSSKEIFDVTDEQSEVTTLHMNRMKSPSGVWPWGSSTLMCAGAAHIFIKSSLLPSLALAHTACHWSAIPQKQSVESLGMFWVAETRVLRAWGKTWCFIPCRQVKETVLNSTALDESAPLCPHTPDARMDH